MSTRHLPWITANLVGAAFGLAGGYLLARPARCRFPAGRLFSVGAQIFVDGPFVEYLASRTRPEPHGEWTLYRLREVGLFLKAFSTAPILRRQTGPLYVLRNEKDQWNVDREAREFLTELVHLGVIESGGYWRSWNEVPRDREVTP